MQFVEPTNFGEIINIDTEFDKEELDRFTKLINIVWKHIIEMDLPDISQYGPTLKGILAFEQDLIDGIV